MPKLKKSNATFGVIFKHFDVIQKLIFKLGSLILHSSGVSRRLSFYKVRFRFQLQNLIKSSILQKLFVYGLYQLQHIAFTCSVYQTIVLAFQRYLAISRPIEYYVDNSVVSMGNGPNGRSILRYMAPVMLFSILFNLPKFFEIDLEEYEFFDTYDNVTKMDLRLKPSKLRLDDNYCFYYVNLARFVVSGLFPFVTLTYLHVAIYR